MRRTPTSNGPVVRALQWGSMLLLGAAALGLAVVGGLPTEDEWLRLGVLVAAVLMALIDNRLGRVPNRYTQTFMVLGVLVLAGRVALGRLDGDADLDLFVGVRGGPSKVWSNDGSGTFTVTPQSLGSASTNAVALGDLNGDGDLDAFLANSGGNTVWFNGGNGHFTDSAQLLGSADTVAVHLFDADGDGDLDAWATNGDGSTQASAVWLNDGDGLFTDSGWALPSMQAGKSAMGNLDGDLDLDVVVVSFFGDHQVWLNQYSGPIFIDGFELGNMNAWSAVVP